MKYLLILIFISQVTCQDYLTCSRPNQITIKSLRSPKYLLIKDKIIKNIPCDLINNNYCNIPGDHYPWHSVRRFVYENQGLIRRMYGEVRQLSVLKMEIDTIENNSIDEDETGRDIDESVGTVVDDVVKNIAMGSVGVVGRDNIEESVGVVEEEKTETTEYEKETTTLDPSHIVYYGDGAKDGLNSTEDSEIQEIKPILKAVNACPVKEEVVAPYWANSTRGEILALLNLYPFEQYIHWEKCNHEHKQMFCRNGCRCEQQYRLHRLLAFDPTNECRGIFSDWFRFPSCCICKCYLTEDEISSHYRKTDLNNINNRSPRYHQDYENQHFFYQPT